MKKKILLSWGLFIFFFLVSFISEAQNTILSGKLLGLSNETVQVFYLKNDISIVDTVTVSQDSFIWKTNLEEPVRIVLTVGNKYYHFFAEPGHIRLSGIKDSIGSYILEGSFMQQDAEAFQESIKDLTMQWDSVYSQLKKASSEEKVVLMEKRNTISMRRDDKVEQFITDHPKSSFSLYLIGLENDYYRIKKLYNKLDESAKQTIVGKRIDKKIKSLSNSQLGIQILDFTLPDTIGNPVALSSFKGQYVLIDFWASWCIPCRAENPNVLKAYNKYKDLGFTILGISLDDKAANWKKAIMDDNLPWTQLSDLKGWKSEIVSKFGIAFIPSNLLIDPSGKIIAKDLRGTMLESKLQELLN